jgi:anti-anti-sigma factor
MFTRIEISGTDVCARLYGALDFNGTQALHQHLAALTDAPQGEVLLDLSGVDGIDEAGLRALAFLFKRLAARRRRLRVIGVAAPLEAPLRDVGLTEAAFMPMPEVTAPRPSRRRRYGAAH